MALLRYHPQNSCHLFDVYKPLWFFMVPLMICVMHIAIPL